LLEPVGQTPAAESYDALGTAYARDGRWEQSEKSFRRAIELQPNRADSHTHFASIYLLPLGRIDETIQQLRIAERNDPLAPEVHFWLGDALADAGRDDDAVKSCEKLPAEDPQREVCILGARMRQGKTSEVVQIYGASRRVSATVLGCAYARLGRREEAEQEARIGATNPGGNRGAEIFACLGDKDRVFEALDREAAVGPVRMGLFLLRVDRENRGLLRGDPRLKALRKKVGLPE
jgi:tetratricopeptide (TPR) repeat protein